MERICINGRSNISSANRIGVCQKFFPFIYSDIAAVIKAGTSIVSTPQGYPSLPRMANIVEHAAELVREGKEVIIVTSGAVGVGKQVLGRNGRSYRTPVTAVGTVDRDILQQKSYNSACAAAGQLGLMSLYSTMFEQYDITTSQLLLTSFDFASPERCGNVKEIMEQLLCLGIVPLLNENDAVSANQGYELFGNTFSDNDSLAALVAGFMGAQLLILLTDVDGLYDRPPSHPKARIISVYNHKTGFEVGAKSLQGRGGMAAKVDAALKAIDSGVQAVVIAAGSNPDTIPNILNGEKCGTLFLGTQAEGEEVQLAEELEDTIEKEARKAEQALQAAREVAMGAREGSRALQKVDTATRECILRNIAQSIHERRGDILAANQMDLENVEKDGLSQQLLHRLKLTDQKLDSLIDGIRSIADQEEPVGKILEQTELSQGLLLEKKACPIGVLLIIFESRPDCLPQIVACAIRSGNGLVLKGGKEAEHSNTLLHSIVTNAIVTASDGQVPGGLVGLVVSRADIPPLLTLDDVIDLVIPRGSAKLVRNIKDNTRIPVMGHADGICHVYVDASADVDKAVCLAVDAKTDYPSACNACETILFHCSAVENGVAAVVLDALRGVGVKVLGGENAVRAGLTDRRVESFDTEYGELTVAVEIVESVEQAIAHIHQHGSAHTDCIITEDSQIAEQFLSEVDSACVFHNASTRFADGYRFGLGAEVGISTSRISPRGPVGVEGLLSFKWVLRSDTSVRHAVSLFSTSIPEDRRLKYTFRKLN